MNSPNSLEHVPVMRDPAVELLGCRSGGVYVDGTIGGGGYAEAILDASAPDGFLIGLDWDGDAIDRVRRRLDRFRERLVLERASFADLPIILKRLNIVTVDGIVLDLGISSYQLDDPLRGFSFSLDGPLDMRMDRSRGETAADLVNSLPEKELADVIYRFGEERWSRRIAGAIVARRKQQPFSRTGELAELIRGAVPKTRDSARIHPATRSFQALRLAVNREQDALGRFLDGALEVLKPGGRLCIVSFHSLEDRMVKVKFREWARSCRCPADAIQCRCEGKPLGRLLVRKVLRPAPEEVESNPRARSARLRAVEKC
ncbi:MAG: 16S rRNA (cytosine(1402)-N(4))-methyltransferase RsmH [Syntrophobacteraceae bacterium]|nr:16S rRNA (cytosine(1402)-N(4))-methyltransferase RsmH [Desulfobacteraceae bacterium]